MAEQIFIQFALILGVAFIVSYILRLFNQPIIVGYIIAGMIISPFLLQSGQSASEIISTFSEFGIAFLLFIVGLHMNPKVLREIGIPSFFIGILQMILTFIVSYAVSFFVLGWGHIASFYVGVAIMFSSTIIIMKLLSDQSDLDSFHGKIVTGVLILQDIVAIFILMIISSTDSISGNSIGIFLVKTFISGGGLILLLFFIGVFILPLILKFVAKTQELLFLFSIAWCFLIASLFNFLNFSIEIGALIAGVILSISPYSTEISSKIRPLRDFFIVIFFIILGTYINFNSIQSILLNAIILSVVALILKPIIVMILMRNFGYTKRNNFLVGITLAQISEFSLIILLLGSSLSSTNPLYIGQEVLNTIVMTLIITIIISAYMIMYSNKLYVKISSILYIFEKKGVKEKRVIKKNYDAILFGYNRIGFGILQTLQKIKKSYVVVDFNPDTVQNLTKVRIPSIYGDAFDSDFLDDLPLSEVKIAVSTIPEFETNLLLIEKIRTINKNAIVILRAHSVKEALELYERGASYVLTPHFLGGEYISQLINNAGTNVKQYSSEKEKHIKTLKSMFERGIEHPKVDKN
ncbi:sodium:proton exchanger [Candidatus Pacearchaeota archaeon CG10_big_fil_rev_8_21_14_0_10_32_14]|nr:MAG: sodium:proton exchanger [Candidatus Pacearchaeota archaeon CG10_big_fil_rev_8_21_14_0_10_32_14]